MAISNPNHHSDSPREMNLSDDSTDNVDFISSLHDSILHHILSFIPTKFAIRTSVLSKRWKRVWQETPSISIDYNREDHVDSINETLSRYSAFKITRFNVSISYGIGMTKMHVDRLTSLAMSRNTENLSLKLESEYIFPYFFYINSSVTQLSLTLRLFHEIVPKCTVSWTSLRNLSLSYCTMSDESIANILSGCPKLESLILNHCAEIYRLDLSRSVNLTRLEITSDGGYFSELAKIVAPHIHYLRLTSFRKLPTLVDVSSLTEANLGYIEYSEYGIMKGDFLQDMVLKILAKLQNVKKLTIGKVVLQILSLAEIRDAPFPQFKIKDLTIETMLVRSVIPGVIRLLQNSPGLKKISVYTIECKAIPDHELEIYLYSQRLSNDRFWSGFFPTAKETSSSFKSVAKVDKSEHVALFMKLVMWKAQKLETVVLRFGGYLNATENQNLLKKVSRNKNFRKDGQGKAILNSFKIIP